MNAPLLTALSAPDGPRPVSERLIVQRRHAASDGLAAIFATEDVSALTDWRIEEEGHTLVVHLAGDLQRMESVFSGGPSTDVRPSVGDVWAIPAGCRYAALAQGDKVRFAEFRLPADGADGGELAARVGHRDPFLHHASARASQLAQREDDLGRMALESLLTAIRFHIADLYLGQRPERLAPPRTDRARRFSDRQRSRLLDHIAASMHEPIRVDGLAEVAGMSISRLMDGFKASFGSTPWQYVLRTRLAEARRLLTESDLSVTAISAAVGFSSPSHFATAFGKHVGASPAAYRREQRNA